MSEARMTGRVRILVWIVAFLFLSLVTRLWFLQVMAAEEYQVRAEGNRVRLVPLPAPRGRILDRNGNVLVDNRRSIQIVVNPRFTEDPDQLLRKLSGLLETPVGELRQRLEDQTYLPYQPVPVAEDVPKRVAFRLKEGGDEYLGASYRAVTVRDHAHGRLAAHILGYLGEISPEELDDPAFKRRGYRPGDDVGRGGVEQHYEEFLRGKPGWLSLQVDAKGKLGERLGTKEPEPGNDLVLSVDLGLQQATEQALREGIENARTIADVHGYRKAPAGAVVALEPGTCDVLAMASQPTFDPRRFLDGPTTKEWKELNDPANNFPLTNRVIQGQYPAASTLKPFMVAAAIRAGMADPAGYYDCPPSFQVPGDTTTVFNNWKSTHSGTISLAQALVESCDTVFYEFGYRFYRERNIHGELMQRQLRRWGFGRPTNVDLPGERVGRVPDSAWKQAVHEYAPKLYPQPLWLPGDNINMSIGQGDLLVTPLQLASAYAAIANGGTLYRPEVGLRIEEPGGPAIRTVEPQELGTVAMNERARGPIHEGLLGAVTQGTAASPFAGFPHESVSVAGKTGTAEVVVDGRDADHSWFAAYAPADDPEVVVVAIVEQGGHGSEVAAPIVRRVLEAYFGLTPSEFRIGAPTD
jgi:penicillin-binding protein 2